jgi:hypothetical protein
MHGNDIALVLISFPAIATAPVVNIPTINSKQQLLMPGLRSQKRIDRVVRSEPQRLNRYRFE